MSLFFCDDYGCYYSPSEIVQDNQETHENYGQFTSLPVEHQSVNVQNNQETHENYRRFTSPPVKHKSVDASDGNASICSQHYEGEANRYPNSHNNDNLWRTILENKIQYFDKMACINPPSSPTTVASLPAKKSSKWIIMVTNPRFITRREQHDVEALLKLQKSLETHDFDTKNRESAVTFNCKDLAKDATYYGLRLVNEATLEANVYRKHFLGEGHPHSADSVEHRTLHRFIQPELEYANNLALPPPYSREISNRRKSTLLRAETAWDIPYTVPELKDKDRQGARFYPDHMYACQASQRDRETDKFRKTHKLPAFRVVEGFECDDLLPVHFLNEDKALQDGYDAAKNYMLLVSAIVLHERLLLASLASTSNDQQFRLKDSHRVFFMTCCGHIATLHEMRLRNIWTLPNPSEMENQPVAYDAIELAKLNMTKELDCELLKQWLNAIHEWGITVHYDSALEDGIKAVDHQASNYITLCDLRQRAFRYGKEPNIIKYHPYRDQVAIDGDTLKKQGGVETEGEDAISPPSKTKRAATEKKMMGKNGNKGKKLGKKRPVTVFESPQKKFTATKELMQNEKSTASQFRRSERLAVKLVHVGVSSK